MKSHTDLIWQEVTWQRPFEYQDVLELLTHLATMEPRSPIVWEMRGRGGQVHYYVGTIAQDMERLKALFEAHGNIQFAGTSENRHKPVVVAKRLKITRPVFSLKTKEHLATTRAVLAVMAQVKPGEEVVLQIVLGRSFPPTTLPNKLPDPNASIFTVIAGNVPTASSESRASVHDKVSSHRLACTVRIGAASQNDSRAGLYVRNILCALRVLESSGMGLMLLPEKSPSLDQANVPWRHPLRLSVKELAALFLLPTGKEELPGTTGLHPRLLLPPAWMGNPAPNMKRSFGVALSASGENDGNESRTLLNISPRDCLGHTHILGPTGAGKTNAMLHLIMGDVHAGRSLLVIDPKADLVNDILARIPDDRQDDVVVIDPSDACPVGFNPLEFGYFSSPELVADAVLAVLKEIFSDSWGIRSQDMLSGALLSLSYAKDSTLLMLPALLTDEGFRHKITSRIDDKMGLGPFWAGFEAMTRGERNQNVAPVLNKMRQFLLRPSLRNVLGQAHPKFALPDLFYKRKIVLVSLNKGIIGAESAQLLGSLIVGLTWTLALSRAKVPPERRHVVNIFIDELQDYLRLPTDLSDGLAQARGLGVGLTVAHQYRSQLPPSIRAGIDANTHNKIVFGLNAGDAKEIAAMAPELEAEDFMRLPRYGVYASLQVNGKSTGWLSGKTLPPMPPLRYAAELKARSMQLYGRPAREVEAEYLDILGYGPRDNPARPSEDSTNDSGPGDPGAIGRTKRK